MQELDVKGTEPKEAMKKFADWIAKVSGDKKPIFVASPIAFDWCFVNYYFLLARQPYLLETSLPGVFSVGDVRGGSIKRVASAVGEGSIAISFVHQVLQE
jgi:hypothetical protein